MFDPVPVLEKVVASLDRDAREPTKLRGLLVPELRKVIETGHREAEPARSDCVASPTR
jgi:[protein-PII] uridylyltransferase